MKRPFLSKTKEGYWHIYYFDEYGKRHSFSTGEKLSGPASDKFDDFKKNIFKPQEKNKKLITEFLSDYLSISEATKSPKTCANIKTAFNEFVRICGNRSIGQYSVLDIDKFLSQKTKEASIWTARKYRIVLNAAFNKAIEWKFVSENPVKKSAKIKKPVNDIVHFDKLEFKNFIESVDNEFFKDIFIFAVLSGLRLNEIMRLKVSDINFKSKIIFVESTQTNPTKDKESRSVELNPHLIPILEKLTFNREPKSPLFTPLPGIVNMDEYVSKKFKFYIKKANINPKLHFHSLRSTFGMWLLNEGINLKFISQQLGHARLSTTEDYYAKYITTKNKGLNIMDYK